MIDHDAIIQIIAEKKLRGGPSKGRNQWELLKRFDGRSVREFIDHAEQATQTLPSSEFQVGRWWVRELQWNVEHGNVRLFNDSRTSNEQEDQPPLAPKPQPTRSAETPNDSGLYVVSLRNTEPISAQADDPRAADRAIKVDYRNCKFGKAKRLSVRKKNYEKTFGAQNVTFVPFVRLDEIDRAERFILQRLGPYKARGRSGRATEWLQGISPEEVMTIARAVLQEEEINHTLIGETSLRR